MSREDYDAPDVLVKVGSVLQFLRKEYERDFAEAIILQTSSSSYSSYRDGLIFLGCFIAGLCFIWGCILLILKINGPSFGCAAGYAVGMFRPPRQQRRRKDSKVNPSDNTNGDGLYLDNTNERPNEDTQIEQQHPENETINASLGETISQLNDGSLASLEQPIRDNIVTHNKKEKDVDRHPWVVENLIQLCFLLLCFNVLLCSILVFSHTLKPLVDAIDHSEHVELDTKDIVNDTIVTLSGLAATSNKSQQIINTFTLDHSVLCPNYTTSEIELTLGVDLQSILDIMDDNYTGLTSQIIGNITEIDQIILEAEQVMEHVSHAYQTSRRYLWIIPTIIFPLCFAVAVAMNGTFQSLRRESTQEFQDFLSKWVLPVLIVFAILCFGVAIVFAMATATGSDACLAGSKYGSPYDTIVEALNVTSNTTTDSEIWQQFALEYASGCSAGTASRKYITKLHREIQQILNFIWKSLSQVDSVGQGNLVDLCGGDERLVELLDGSRDLAKLLYSAQVGVKQVNESLSCDNVYPIYNAAVNQLMCTETVSATTWGFLLFLSIGVSIMGIISLRAAWSYKAAEEKIFDDNEVAENVILDEHEEYLHYISAYKHEWEEYRGVTVPPPDTTQPVSLNREEDSTDSSTSTEPDEHPRYPMNDANTYSEASSVTDSDVVSESTSIEVVDGPEQVFNPYISTDSQTVSSSTSEDNISFLSLNVTNKVDNLGAHPRPVSLKLPPSLLQERDDQERDDYDDHTFIHDYEESRDDDDGDHQADLITHGNVTLPTSQVQIMKTKYKMIPSTTTTTTTKRSNSAIVRDTTSPKVHTSTIRDTTSNTTTITPKIYHKPSISKILDELEELSTSKLNTPSPRRVVGASPYNFSNYE